MRNFYLIIMGAAGIYLLVQLVAYLFYGKVFFDSTGTLFENKQSRFEWQTVFPKNLLLLVIFALVSAVFGFLLDLAGVVGWLSLPLCVFGGLTVNFLINYTIMPRFYSLNSKGRPTDAQLDGAEALVTEDIYPKDYGKIEVENGGRSYTFDAVCANETRILSGERVIVIYAEDGLCFVESVTRFCDVLFEDEPLQNRDTADFTKTEEQQ